MLFLDKDETPFVLDEYQSGTAYELCWRACCSDHRFDGSMSTPLTQQQMQRVLPNQNVLH